MLSENGFKHHLNNIAHSTVMHQTYGFDEHLVSVENSKGVLLDAFIKQNENIEQKQQEIERLKEDNERLLNLKETLEEANQGMATKVEEQQQEIEVYRNSLEKIIADTALYNSTSKKTVRSYAGNIAYEALGNKR